MFLPEKSTLGPVIANRNIRMSLRGPMNRFSPENTSQKVITAPIRIRPASGHDSLFQSAETVLIQRKTNRGQQDWLETLTSKRFLTGSVLFLCGVITALLMMILNLHLN